VLKPLFPIGGFDDPICRASPWLETWGERGTVCDRIRNVAHGLMSKHPDTGSAREGWYAVGPLLEEYGVRSNAIREGRALARKLGPSCPRWSGSFSKGCSCAGERSWMLSPCQTGGRWREPGRSSSPSPTPEPPGLSRVEVQFVDNRPRVVQALC